MGDGFNFKKIKPEIDRNNNKQTPKHLASWELERRISISCYSEQQEVS